MNDGQSPIERMIDSVMKCSLCEAPMGTCDCWTHCSCGWWAKTGYACRNPETTRCSTKMKCGRSGSGEHVTDPEA